MVLAGELEVFVDQLRVKVRLFDPSLISSGDAKTLVELFSALEKVSSAGRVLALRRVEETFGYKSEGFRNAATWMAAKTGSSLGAATSELETSRRLNELPAVESAFRSGTLSCVQAEHVSRAAAIAPELEVELLASASNKTVRQLQDQARRIEASADLENLRYESMRKRRYFRSWTESDGMVRVDGRLMAEDGARFLAVLSKHENKVFKDMRSQGLREPHGAYRSDALVSMAVSGGSWSTKSELSHGTEPSESDHLDRSGGIVSTTVNVRVDYSALMRGHVVAGEVCEIDGIGPIPVSRAKELAQDSFLKVLVTDKNNVKTVRHRGRTIPSRVRSALEQRDQCCVVPGCDSTRFLEIDHYKVPFHKNGPPELWNLARICHHHHRLKTVSGFELEGGPGEWKWIAPD